MKRTEFSTEVDTFDKFLEVIWNCSKNYLSTFIQFAIEKDCPIKYVEVAKNTYHQRFMVGR